jgi:hypothetical protein
MPKDATENSDAKLCSTSFEEIERADLIERPYEVWHPDGEGSTPKFATWGDAIASQKKWNADCPGHVARKRRCF